MQAKKKQQQQKKGGLQHGLQHGVSNASLGSVSSLGSAAFAASLGSAAPLGGQPPLGNVGSGLPSDASLGSRYPNGDAPTPSAHPAPLNSARGLNSALNSARGLNPALNSARGAPPVAQHQQRAPPPVPLGGGVSPRFDYGVGPGGGIAPTGDMVAQAVAMQLGHIAQQQAFISQQLAQSAATMPNFNGSALQTQLMASLQVRSA